MLLSGSVNSGGVHFQGAAYTPGGPENSMNRIIAGPDFFETIGIPLQTGRRFDARDTAGAAPALMLNATAARIHFGSASSIGHRVSLDGPDGPWREIVGVVRDSKYGSLTEQDVPVAYLPLAQNHETGMTLYVRTSVPPASLATALRREIQTLEPNLPVPEITTMSESIATSLFMARLGTSLVSGFGVLALLLAVVGVYGVLSFSVARRTREMGIRLALGAASRQVFLLVVRDGMVLVGLGAAIGLGGGLLAAWALRALLYGISPTDLPAFGGAVATLGGIGLLACVVPARRAIRVNPVATLRQE
jgi:putative ABC transport system permease protein